jgi:3-isopropylmalate/(R)-2-methylmalate dehydratase small subunit
MILKGRAWKYGDNVNTDEIIPARYLNTSDPKILASHCLEDLDKNFAKEVKKGDLIVALKNFGCGSSREHAPIAIKNVGVSCVIAQSFARIFYRNAINIGLLLIESTDASRDIQNEDIIEIDLKKNKIINLTQNRCYSIMPIPKFIQEIVEEGGLIPYLKRKIDKEKRRIKDV